MRAGNRIGILLLIAEMSTVEHGPVHDFLRDALESSKLHLSIKIITEKSIGFSF